MLEALLVPHIAVPLLYDALIRRAARNKRIEACEDRVERAGISVIIPVRNEYEHLRQKLEELCVDNKHLDLEIIIIDSSDVPLMLQMPETCNVKYIYFKERGKVKALNKGIDMSTKEILLFTDVDAHGVTPDVIMRVLPYLYCEEIALVTPKITYSIKDKLVRWLERNYFKKAVTLSIEESKVWSSTVFTGSFMMIRKSYLEQLGGFPEDVGADDTFLAHRVSLILGKRAVWLDVGEITEFIDERFTSYLKKKVRRAQHLQQAFVRSLRLLPRGKAPRKYKLMMITRFYLNLINPVFGLLGYLASTKIPPLFGVLTATTILTPWGRLWAVNQLALLIAMIRNVITKDIAWK
jgi:cellulose synthase/poly-beta-1,6-N-acetylglucosamine synthase-like glycosyltransferase